MDNFSAKLVIERTFSPLIWGNQRIVHDGVLLLGKCTIEQILDLDPTLNSRKVGDALDKLVAKGYVNFDGDKFYSIKDSNCTKMQR